MKLHSKNKRNAAVRLIIFPLSGFEPKTFLILSRKENELPWSVRANVRSQKKNEGQLFERTKQKKTWYQLPGNWYTTDSAICESRWTQQKEKWRTTLRKDKETGIFFICIIAYFSTTLFASVANYFHILMLKPTIFRFQGIAWPLKHLVWLHPGGW